MPTLEPFTGNRIRYWALTKPLDGFAFLEGGSVSLSVTSFTATLPTALKPPTPMNETEVPLPPSSYLQFATCDQSRFTFSENNDQPSISKFFCRRTNSSFGCAVTPFSYYLNGGDAMTATVRINSTGIYDSFIIACTNPASPSISFSYDFSATNPGPNYVRYLGSFEIQALYIDLVFLCLWILVLFGWIFAWLRNMNMRNKLHTSLTSIPVTKTAWFAYKTVRYFLVGSGVVATTSVEHARILFHVKNSVVFLNDFAMIACFAVMAKGWGVLRFHMSPLEKRSLLGAAFLYSLTGVLCSYKIEFMFSFWTFGIAVFYYLFWTANVHIQNSIKYCTTLKVKLESIRTSGVNSIGIPAGMSATGLRSRRQESVPAAAAAAPAAAAPAVVVVPPVQNDVPVAANTGGMQAEVVDTGTASFFQFARQEIAEWVREASWELVFPKQPKFPRDIFSSRVAGVGDEWKLLWTMEAKLWMVKSANNIIVFYAFCIFLDKAIQFLNQNVIPFYPTYPNLYGLLGFLWIAYVYRLRQPEQVIVVPGWILANREKMGETVSIDSDGSGDRRRAMLIQDLRRWKPMSPRLDRVLNALGRSRS
ncbi:hypothetical protein HDU77_009720 [Chytriomyces hyalinus]|nr:hypothetical protein HDU77_009720 [Chytriomyces hyalinus]